MIGVWRRRDAQSLIAVAALVLWLGSAAILLSQELAHTSKLGIIVCVALILGPLLAVNLHRLPSYLFAGYALLVPFTDLLASNMGGSYTKLVGVAAAGCVLVSMVLSRRCVWPSKPAAAVIALSLYVGLTIFWAIDSSKALDVYVEFLNYSLFFVLISLYPVDSSELKLILAATVLGALGSAIYGGSIFLHGQQLPDVRVNLRYDATTKMDPNEYAATLLTPIALTLTLFVRSRLGLWKICCLGLLAALLFGLAVSGSRGAGFALLTMFVFMFWDSRRKKQMLTMCLAAVILLMTSPVGQRLLRPDTLSANGRTDIWKVATASLHQYWLLGAGAGNFADAFNQYYLAVAHSVFWWDVAAHSLFLQSEVEYGLVGFLLVMTVWFLMFRDLRDVQSDPELGAISLALRASVLGLFVAGFSLDLLMYKYTWLTFSLVALTRSAFLSRRRSAPKALQDAA